MVNHVDRIISILTRANAYEHPSRVFEDWLSVVDGTLTMLPLHLASVLSSRTFADDTPGVRAIWDDVKKRQPPAAFPKFAEAFGVLLDSTTDGDSVTYHDTLGDVYMRMAANSQSGQFFTPWAVAKMMAEMQSDHGVEVTRRLEIERETGEPFQPVTVHDPACGSGVLLLAFASTYPRHMIEQGRVLFSGQDVDPTCVRMAKCNIRLYGMNHTALPLLVHRKIQRTPVRRVPVTSLDT